MDQLSRAPGPKDPGLLGPEVARLFAAKEARRRHLAALSFPEKVCVVVRMQQMVAPILRARGRKVRIWAI